jgi:uncharacterized protein YdaU (DUF1376 family)
MSLYLTLLAHEWSLGSLPMESQKLMRICRWTRKNFERAWPQVSQKFVEREGRLYNVRLEEHREKSAEISGKRAQSGRIGAVVRHGKQLANASNLPKQNGGNCQNFVMPSNPIQSNPIQACALDEHTQDARARDDRGTAAPIGSVPRGTDAEGARSPVTRAAAVCIAMRAEGLVSANPAHPLLLELLKAGAEVGEFASAAKDAVARGKDFAYALGVVRGRRADAVQIAAAPRSARKPEPVRTWEPPDEETANATA